MPDPLGAFPVDINNGDTPDADVVMNNFEWIRQYLNPRLGNLTPNQLLIADASGRLVGRTIHGDITIAEDGEVHVDTPACSVFRDPSDGTQPVADNVEVAVQFPQEEFDNAAMHNPATTPSRITVPRTGIYLFEGGIEWGSNFDWPWALKWLKNGTGPYLYPSEQRKGADVPGQGGRTQGIFKLTAGDYIQLLVHQWRQPAGSGLTLPIFDGRLSCVFMGSG